jgi:hypothetical protein
VKYKGLTLKITKFISFSGGLAISLVLACGFNTRSMAVTTQIFTTDFAPFLPNTFNQTDSFNLKFRIHDPNRDKPIHVVKIIYHIVTPLLTNIFIPLYFSKLSPESSSSFTAPLGSSPPDGASLTLAGLGGFAETNSFMPFDFGIQRSDIVNVYLTTELELDGLTPGDGSVVTLNLNGSSLGGSQIAESVPEPSTILGASTAILFGTFFKRNRKISHSSNKATCNVS